MTQWLTDPKSIALMAGAAVQLIITVFHARETAKAVEDLAAWRLEVVGTLATLEAKADQSWEEINRLRSLLERT